jgi:phage head maturation protease
LPSRSTGRPLGGTGSAGKNAGNAEESRRRGLGRVYTARDVSRCSFAFRTLDDDWSRDEDGTIVRRLLKVDIHDGDVAAVTFPACPDTDVSVRAFLSTVDNEIESHGREVLDRREAEKRNASAEAREREIELAMLE